jgi:hypothetical protein
MLCFVQACEQACEAIATCATGTFVTSFDGDGECWLSAGRQVGATAAHDGAPAGSLLSSLMRLSSVVLGYSRRMRRAVWEFRSQTRGGQRLVSGQLRNRCSCYCFCEGISATVGEREGTKEQGNSDKGRTTRPHARTTAEKQGENRRTELGRDSNVPETHFSHLRACAAQSGAGKVL